MNVRKFAPYFLAGLLLVGLSSCRTSQQTRRSGSTAGRTGSVTSTDSILIIQQKLINLIDTMAGVLERDTKRIRQLEQEIARLKARLGGSSNLILQPPPVPVPQYASPEATRQLPYMSVPTNGTSGSVSTVTSGYSPTGVSIRDMSDREKEAALPPPSNEYTDAVMQFNARKYKEAFRRFDQLAQNEPNSVYTPNYVFWRGESLFAMERYADAAIDFKAVADKYPESLKGDDAQLKYAESLERIGARSQALLEYRRLLERYPLTEYRSRAVSRMRSLQ